LVCAAADSATNKKKRFKTDFIEGGFDGVIKLIKNLLYQRVWEMDVEGVSPYWA